MVSDIMVSVRQAKQEVTMAVAQHHGCCTRGLVCAHVVCEILSHLLVLVVAWFTTAYVIAPYFLAHYVLALQASDLAWWELLQSPLLWLFPPGTGRLVAPSHGGRLGPKSFRVLSWCVRLAVLGWMVWTTLQLLERSKSAMGKKIFNFPSLVQVACSRSHHCDGLPPWLRHPWWSGEEQCPVTGNSYTDCLGHLPWYFRGICNMRAGQCYQDALPQWARFVAAGGPMAFGPFLALPASLCLSYCISKALDQGAEISQEETEDVSSEDESAVVEINSKVESEDVTVFKRLKFFTFDLFPFVLDVFLDLNGILQFILTGNFQFAIVSTGIFAMSIAQQLRRGILHKFGQAAIESMHRAHATDDLEVIMLSEKSVEAATQLMLQYYAFYFVTSSEFAVWSFLFSMALSLRSVADAVYYLIELDLFHVITSRSKMS